MRIVLVLSEITYVPDNCNGLLREIVEKNSKHICGLVVLTNFSLEIILKIIWLYTTGCPKVATALLINIFGLLSLQKNRILKEHQISIIKAKDMNQTAIIEWTKNHHVDCIINVRTRSIYRKNILETPRLGCFNIHHGLLPKYRGMYCDLYALHENRSAGISLHKMNEKIDDGNIIYTKVVSNNKEKDYLKYLSLVRNAEIMLINKFIRFLEINDNPPTGKVNKSQNVVYTRTPTKAMIKQLQKNGMIL